MKEIKDLKLYLIITVLMSLIFCIIYGYKILIPTNVNWTLHKETGDEILKSYSSIEEWRFRGGPSDLDWHQVGWQGFRNSSWMFPIGLSDSLSYPNKISVIFTDSIPLFAIFFKLLSPVLPADFQYFGLWGLLCFILQGVLAAYILRRFTSDYFVLTLVALIFAFTPVMIWRMFHHTALAGQWILLLALSTLFQDIKGSERSLRNRWLVMGLLFPTIHIYFGAMCGIVLLGFCLRCLFYQKIALAFKSFVCYIISALVVTWLLGGFATEGELKDSGLGLFSMNANALFNPQGWSAIFNDLPYLRWQYEGFAYLGAGWLLLLIIVLLLLIFNKIFKKQKIFTSPKATLIPLVLISFISFIFALSNKVSFNSASFKLHGISEDILDLWSIFRSTGRFSWIIVYILMLSAVILTIKLIKHRKIRLMIFSCILILQIYDIHKILISKHEYYHAEYTDQYAFLDTPATIWQKIADSSDIKHIILVSDWIRHYTFANWAMRHHKTLNRYQFTRSSFKTLWGPSIVQALNNPDTSNVYINLKRDGRLRNIPTTMNYYTDGDYVIFYMGNL